MDKTMRGEITFHDVWLAMERPVILLSEGLPDGSTRMLGIIPFNRKFFVSAHGRRVLETMSVVEAVQCYNQFGKPE